MSTPFSERFRCPASTRVQRSPGIGKQSPSRAMVTLGPLLYGKLKKTTVKPTARFTDPG
jgi:hypothetical protein